MENLEKEIKRVEEVINNYEKELSKTFNKTKKKYFRK